MQKKDLRTLFKAIEHKRLESIEVLVGKNPDLVNLYGMAPPIRLDGVSPLQFSLRTGDFTIAEFLLDKGGDVNHMESSHVKTWCLPVFHDCIKAVMAKSFSYEDKPYEFEKGFSLLSRMIDCGADIRSLDSFENNCMVRVVLDARKALEDLKDTTIKASLITQIRRLTELLMDNGGDPHEICRNISAFSLLSEWRLLHLGLIRIRTEAKKIKDSGSYLHLL